MAKSNSTASSSLLEATDLLSETETIVSFIQSITLINPQNGSELSLSDTQVTGLYYVLKNVRENLAFINEKINFARAMVKD